MLIGSRPPPPIWRVILGTHKSASEEEIRAAYEQRLQELPEHGRLGVLTGEWVSRDTLKASLDEMLETALAELVGKVKAQDEVAVEDPTLAQSPLFDDGWKCPRIDQLPRF